MRDLAQRAFFRARLKILPLNVSAEVMQSSLTREGRFQRLVVDRISRSDLLAIESVLRFDIQSSRAAETSATGVDIEVSSVGNVAPKDRIVARNFGWANQGSIHMVTTVGASWLECHDDRVASYLALKGPGRP